jgi:hypothetical protein
MAAGARGAQSGRRAASAFILQPKSATTVWLRWRLRAATRPPLAGFAACVLLVAPGAAPGTLTALRSVASCRQARPSRFANTSAFLGLSAAARDGPRGALRTRPGVRPAARCALAARRARVARRQPRASRRRAGCRLARAHLRPRAPLPPRQRRLSVAAHAPRPLRRAQVSAFLDAAAAKAKVGVEQLQVLTLDGKVTSGRGKVRAAQRARASKPGFEPLASPRPRAPLHPAHAARRETRAAHASHAPRLLPAPDGACIASGLTRPPHARSPLAPPARPGWRAWPAAPTCARST